MTQMVTDPHAMQETRGQSLCQEDPLEEGMAVHSSILAWRIPWSEEPGGPKSMGSQRVRHNQVTIMGFGYPACEHWEKTQRVRIMSRK